MTKILVIEDEESIRENIVELLESEEFEAIGCANGLDGVRLATEQQPDLILCDVMMPELDGYQVLSTLRSQSKTTTIPFIFLTAKADKSDTRKGMELGADDYLVKPCTADELLRAIISRLEKQARINKQSQEKLNELRNSIALSLPHELRTPLNGILSCSQIILNQLNKSDEKEINIQDLRQMVELINVSGKRLYRLIQNFLLYADLEILATNLQRREALRNDQTFFLKGMAEEQVKALLYKTDRLADLQLNLQDASLQIASLRLNKIIEELCDNACKFSPPGTPIIFTTIVKYHRFTLSVTNQGRGMTKEQIMQIGAYMQFDRKMHEQQGSGLGLIIVKRLAELHGGELKIESIPHERTTVSVILPIAD